MTSEIEAVPCCIMELVERSYCTKPGWRLATFQEANENLQMIKQQGLLKGGERARLLDGWISGSSYSNDIQMRDEFRSCLGHMLIIQLHPSISYSAGNSNHLRSIYADVKVDQKGREAALFLCSEDWNYEVVYWLLNFWEKKEIFESVDVREGNIPFSNKTKFVEMNRRICHIGRILGEEGLAGRKAAKRKFSKDSVEEVMFKMVKSCWDKFSQEDKKILGQNFLRRSIDEFISNIIRQCSEVNWFENFASEGDMSDAIWHFLWFYISSSIAAGTIRSSIGLLIKEWGNDECQTRSPRNFIISSAILFHLSRYEENKVRSILLQACKDAADDGQYFKATLQNPQSAYYDEAGNYDLLSKILIYAVDNKDNFVVNKVLEWGAQPQVDVGPDQQNRALYFAIQNNRKDIVKSLFDKCRSKEQFANVADEDGWTALHSACFTGDLSICEMVLEYGGRPDVPDNTGWFPLHRAVYNNREEIVRSLFNKCHLKEKLVNAKDKEGLTALHYACRDAGVSVCEMVLQNGGKTDVADNKGRLPLHYAVERENEDIVDILIREGDSDTVHSEVNQKRAELVTWKDNDGVSPLDMAVKEYNIKVMGKLLSVSQQLLETYFDKADSEILLRKFASEGNLEAVRKLLERGADPRACDEEGRTALHYASMCELGYNADKLTELMLHKCRSEEESEKWVEKKDNNGKTALHFAAMKGHQWLCHQFCNINREILQIKDETGRGVFYDAVQGDHHDNPNIIWQLLQISGVDVESIVDNSGLTLLHVAVSEGRMNIADFLLRQSKKPKLYVRTPDVLGQTVLHKAAKVGHADTIKVLLHWGAHPLLERDCDGRTVFHYFAQPQLTGDDGKAVAELLLKKCGSDEKKLLLLWASAAGLGTADQHLSDSPLKEFLLEQRKHITVKVGQENNLLRTAARLGDIDMTKELLSRGAQIADIKDHNWRERLKPEVKNNVLSVCKQIERIAEQGNDKPTTSDNLGRSDFAYGLAALLLNPYLKPPITVGISGSWGMGKSSLMEQTEGILLKTAAQLAVLPSETTSSSFPGFQILEHTERGKKKYRQIKTGIDLLVDETKVKSKFFQSLKNKIVECCMKIKNSISGKTSKEGDSLRNFLRKYDPRYHHIFKSLAAMDSTGMFKEKGQQSQSVNDSSKKEGAESEIDSFSQESVPAVLTVRYNAWKYRNESEALAGMAVEITKEMEGIMTDAQWLSTCLRNTWRKQKQVILIEIIFPCLFAVLLATSFTLIVWVLLERYKIKESVELKYASLPLTVVILVWTLVKKVMSTVNPVSIQLMNYIKLPDHNEKLGYQERVISDINFLKEEISKNPIPLCKAASDFITGPCNMSLISSKYSGENLTRSKPSANLRTIVFVDDLDRCQESVILQVLSAINLVLAVCKISVVLGMDKDLIQRAIMKKYGDKSLKNSKLADKYLQKIIQLPLDLPDPSEVQSKKFLEGQLGVFEKERNKGHMESEADGEDDSVTEIDEAYNALFSTKLDFEKIFGSTTPIPDTPEVTQQKQKAETTIIDMEVEDGTNASSSQHNTNKIEVPPQSDTTEGDQSFEELIPIKELLFVRYSEGERGTFCHFEEMTTDIRKLPREWKRFLTYHRLVWNIFLINNEARDLDGWQVQLITWIFVCWEFEENMNILMENWDRLRVLKGKEPSLRMVVDHFISNERWIIADHKSEKERDGAKVLENSVNKDTAPQHLEEDKKQKGVSINEDNPKRSNLEPSEPEVPKDQVIAPMESQGYVSNDTNYCETSTSIQEKKLKEAMTEEDVSSEKTLKHELDALKEEMKEMKNQLDRIEKLQAEQAGSLKVEMFDRIGKLQVELEKQVDSIVKQRQVRWSEKSAEEKKLKLENWGRLKFALQRYDVSMKGIQVFQRFRFYCVAGYLPWPVPERKIVDIQDGSSKHGTLA
ncbi:hypothetical protein SUGI_0716420 [Cryptomeria japonica]|uniref:uncharacterized protein LOC131048595 n=1 Tax=Cryptomeria japonica TaxID=3369 RepID=UPI0024148343|nr:uncharacterized protein LOC131048595 [Cryptomeria japonica]XP_059063974.1 uncharacterized protein LOC131048595 [Cryptomeria japonica]XP_059063975.1 uncharacterized protein LOC131048595 [Cryptomeria japonica]XP_059063976.1 uncharacterized protein LOC131048595 [Cryptomeria japonica]XP_059063977.1 uncharacterized protein LOC131048595 [Cryptomeria japonica]XP_059063978.1 uncharacterized protein LOC131048595 [Cryptomeria japonica]GLJ35642.1 hypothetical protein SUGI_0716420 [Cryptomeria japonic